MKKSKSFGLYSLIFAVTFCLSFVFVWSLLTCINEFFTIAGTLFLCCSIVFSLLVSITVIVYLVINSRRPKNAKLTFWLGTSYPDLLIGYLLLVFAFLSVRNTVTWTADEIRNVLSIQWTIFGLSLTIFFVWKVLMVNYFKTLQPKAGESIDSVQQYKLLLKKRSFSQDIETTFISVVFLTINLFLLLLSTSLIYVIHLPENIFTQNITMCTFYFTSNTIAMLFIDILKPLKRDKTNLMKENIVTKEELDQAKANVFLQLVVDGIKNAIMSSDKYTDKEKKEKYASFLSALRGAVSKEDEPKTKDSSEDTPSMEGQNHVETTEL